MDQEYDVIVLGTGLKECILSGLMSLDKKKVLHLDRNSYYGGESASLNLEQLYERFPDEEKKLDTSVLGASREYCVDLCPKFLLACGDLVKILLLTQVTNYLEFRSVAGSFVQQKGKLRKVPSTPKEALTSSLLGLKQKNNFQKFLTFVGKFEADNTDTHKNMDLTQMTAKDLMEKFSLSENVVLFTGHAICLYLNDQYLERPAMELIERCQLYANSVARYGNSPYIYPKWGLGGLPEGFSRRSAVHGGVYMLNCENVENFIDEIQYDDEGKAAGIKLGVKIDGKDEAKLAKDGIIIGDPSYWKDTDKVKETQKVIRKICILDHPIENTNKADSCQIIIPAGDVDRKNDIYICVSSYQHNTAADGKWLAVCSTIVEDHDNHTDLEHAEKLIGESLETFSWVSNYYEPDPENNKDDNCFITSSYDATTHFQTCSEEVLKMYEAITGSPLDFSSLDVSEEDGETKNED